jgi:signal transduction histidine kinase
MIALPFFLLLFIVLISFFNLKPENHDSLLPAEDELKIRAYNVLMASDLNTACVDTNLNIVFCNENFAALYKRSPTELVNHNLLTDFPFSVHGKLFATLQKMKGQNKFPKKPVILFVNLQTNPQQLPSSDLLVHLRPYVENGCQLMLVVFAYAEGSEVIHDNLLQSLKQKDTDLKKLEEIDHLKSEFLATLSHELKTPLVSIRGYMELMATEKFGPLTDGQKKALRVSLRNTGHLNKLISSILNFARMEAGKLRFDLMPQKIGPLIRSAVDSLQPIADNSTISCKPFIASDLPKVIIDADLISRVLINLLDNSIKFSPPNSVIDITARKVSDKRIRINVIDKGCGIAKEKLEKIKTPFYQINKSDTRPKGGLGLGLAICEKILAGHDSKLEINSEPGEGCDISFEIPIAKNQTAGKGKRIL